jgi:hypothetical protein
MMLIDFPPFLCLTRSSRDNPTNTQWQIFDLITISCKITISCTPVDIPVKSESISGRTFHRNSDTVPRDWEKSNQPETGSVFFCSSPVYRIYPDMEALLHSGRIAVKCTIESPWTRQIPFSRCD